MKPRFLKVKKQEKEFDPDFHKCSISGHVYYGELCPICLIEKRLEKLENLSALKNKR